MPRPKEFIRQLPIWLNREQLIFLEQTSILEERTMAEIVRTALNEYRARARQEAKL